MNRNRASHNVSVGYHMPVKIIAGLYTWESNHLAFEVYESIYLDPYNLNECFISIYRL